MVIKTVTSMGQWECRQGREFDGNLYEDNMYPGFAMQHSLKGMSETGDSRENRSISPKKIALPTVRIWCVILHHLRSFGSRVLQLLRHGISGMRLPPPRPPSEFEMKNPLQDASLFWEHTNGIQWRCSKNIRKGSLSSIENFCPLHFHCFSVYVWCCFALFWPR